jgi:hypothetical protein
MNPTPDVSTLTSLLPAHYAGYAALAVAIIPLLTRAYYSISNNGGIVGVFHAIFFGTNTPKVLVGCLCMLSLTSCAGLTAFIASPLGQVSIVTAEALGKQLATTAESKVLEQIILKAQAQIATLNAQGVSADTGKEIVRQSELLGLASVVTAAQQQYTGLTGHSYTLPKNPLVSVNP